MAMSMFLQVDGVTGESADSNHTGWIDVSSFTWGAQQPGNMSTGGGGGAGKVAFSDLHITTKIDKATTTLLKFCANGKHVASVVLSICKSGGEQIEYSKITLTDVLITSVDYTGSSDGDLIGISYSFQASKVQQQYWVQTSSGTKGAESSTGWDIKANKEV